MNIRPVENPLLNAALAYAERGWGVIPLHRPQIGHAGVRCSCRKTQCPSIGKHPLSDLVPNGLTDATSDPDIIRDWWAHTPAANVGIVGGMASGVWFLDIDGDEGQMSLQALMDKFGELPETVEAITGSGGVHLAFAHPGVGTKIKSVNGRFVLDGAILPGLDVKGDGGYVVAAPSLHASERRYAWRPGCSPAEIGLSVAPDWLLSLVTEKPATPIEHVRRRVVGDAARRWLGKALASVGTGNRNDTGLWLATQLRDEGISEDEAMGIAREYAERVPRGDKPYTVREAEATVKSAYSRPKRDPAASKSTPIRSGPRPPSPQPSPDGELAPMPIGAASRSGAVAELREWSKGVEEGRIYDARWPWETLTRATRANQPGSITVVCGEPGVGKTFWILDCLRFWHGNGIESAVMFLEKDRKFHVQRLVAQLDKNGMHVDIEGVKSNVAGFDKVIDANEEYIEELGRLIYGREGRDLTLDDVGEFVEHRAAEGCRVIIIDPITAAAAGIERWTKDDEFIRRCETALVKHGASLVLVTHPKQAAPGKGEKSGHGMGGGAGYFRFCDTTLWLTKRKKARRVTYLNEKGNPGMVRATHFWEIPKARLGKGSGWEIACGFDLSYTEYGVVTGDAAEDDPDSLAGQVKAAAARNTAA